LIFACNKFGLQVTTLPIDNTSTTALSALQFMENIVQQ